MITKRGVLIIGMVSFLTGIFNIQGYSQVIINESPSVERLMESYKSFKQSESKIRGWRIQIITTDDRRQMEKARNKFSGLYPHIRSTWVHESPYYKVKVGAYKNKMDLQGLLYELKKDFRGVIPIVEKIHKKDLLM